jgi:hypothetical protein
VNRRKSLAERVIAQGIEPETEEGGRAMLQSLTMADVRAIKPRTPSIATGTEVMVSIRYVGGTVKERCTVVWDNGRGRVDVKGSFRSYRAEKDANGGLYAYPT